jgi:hypothetical protein
MIYILFATVIYSKNVVSFTHTFNDKLDCETTLHNLKMEMNASEIRGFCQGAKK